MVPPLPQTDKLAFFCLKSFQKKLKASLKDLSTVKTELKYQYALLAKIFLIKALHKTRE